MLDDSPRICCSAGGGEREREGGRKGEVSYTNRDHSAILISRRTKAVERRRRERGRRGRSGAARPNGCSPLSLGFPCL